MAVSSPCFDDISKSPTRQCPRSSSPQDSEYSDPDIESDSCDSDLDGLTDLDRRNLSNPAKLPLYADAIYLAAQCDSKRIPASSHRITSLQTQITRELREFAVTCVFAVQQQYDMTSETLFQAVTFLNIVLSHVDLPKEQLRLVLMTCFWMSAKMEENGGPKLCDINAICQNAYREDDFLDCERRILAATHCRLAFPTAVLFLERFLDAICATPEIREAANFFCELALIPIDFVDLTPDVIALAAVCAARLSLAECCPTKRLMAYAHLTDVEAVRRCCGRLIGFAMRLMAHTEHLIYYRFTAPPAIGVILRMKLNPDLAAKL
jgi:hypothetical protein